jgi:transcription elongation factor Elf1
MPFESYLCSICGLHITTEATGQPKVSAGSHDPACHVANAYHVARPRNSDEEPQVCQSCGEEFPCSTRQTYQYISIYNMGQYRRETGDFMTGRVDEDPFGAELAVATPVVTNSQETPDESDVATDAEAWYRAHQEAGDIPYIDATAGELRWRKPFTQDEMAELHRTTWGFIEAGDVDGLADAMREEASGRAKALADRNKVRHVIQTPDGPTLSDEL